MAKWEIREGQQQIAGQDMPVAEIWHNGIKIGTIEHTKQIGTERGYTVRGRFVEDADGNCLHYSSISASGTVTEVQS